MGYCDEILHTHWYWQDVSNEIVIWHLGERSGSVVECRTPEREVRGSRPTAAVLCPWARHFTPRKYWLITRKRWLRPDMTEKLLTGTLSLNTTIWHLRLVEFLPRFKFWKKWDYCKMTFINGRGFAECQILKKWKWPYLLNWVEYIDRVLHKHWYYQDLA